MIVVYPTDMGGNVIRLAYSECTRTVAKTRSIDKFIEGEIHQFVYKSLKQGCQHFGGADQV